MLQSVKNFIQNISSLGKEEDVEPLFDASDKKLAAAALMFHVIAADGVVQEEEQAKLRSILCTHYDVDAADIEKLVQQAKLADSEAVDLYAFTSTLKNQLSNDERILLVEDLWEMVFADGELHEFEDNIVWRVAELIAVSPQDRMTMKQRVQKRYSNNSE